MSQEIIYTSAPQGLKPGSRGFCTVVSTDGMAKNLAERLESLSGYRHVFLPHEPEAHRNPVNFSHQILSIGGQKYHVLSRIADGGVDYSQRSNKLAHHIAIDPRECAEAPGGPAWVLSSNDFVVTKWDGEVKIIPPQHFPRPDDCPMGICDSWQSVAGDAGWAGVLAESAQQSPGRPMPIIYELGTDVLPLVVEAMSLLPRQKRWDVTFSTYFTRLPAGVECQWRFLLNGTQEATALQRNPHATMIDLTQTLGRAKGGPLVDVARTGEASVSHQVAPPSRASAPRAASASGIMTPPVQNQLLPVEEELYSELVPPPVADVATAPIFSSKRTSNPLLWASVAVLLLVPTLFAVYFFAAREPAAIAVAPVEDPREPEQTPPSHIPPLQQPHEPKDPPPPDPEPPEFEFEKNPPKSVPDPVAKADDKDSKPNPNSQPKPPEKEKRDPLEDVRGKNNALALPERKSFSGADTGELAKLYVDDLHTINLTLESGIIPLDAKFPPKIEKDPEIPGSWSVVVEKQGFSGIEKTKLGIFSVKNQTLFFRWGDGSEPSAIASKNLQFQLLTISVGNKKEPCKLLTPVEAPPITVKADKKESRHPIPPLEPSVLAHKDLLRIEAIGFENLLQSKVKYATPSKSNCRVQMFGEENAPNPFGHFDLRIAWPQGDSAQNGTLVIKGVWHIDYLVNGELIKRPIPLNADEIKECKKTCTILTEALPRKIKTAEGGLRPLRSQLSDSEKRLKKSPKKPEAIKSRIAFLKREIKQREDVISLHERALGVATSNIALCDKMLVRCEKLNQGAKIHYRIYLENNGQQLDVVHSKKPQG